MSLQNKFMRGIKQIGIDKFDVVRLFANETATIARLNFISPGNLTAVSVGSPSFSQYVGYVSNGNPNRVSEPVNLSALTKYTQNDCHVYGYFSSYASGVNASHGVVR